MKKRGISLAALAMVLATASLAGCSKDKADEPAASAGATAAASPAATGITFPLAKQETLKIWTTAYASLLNLYPEQGELPIYKELTKQTNIKFQVVTPVSGQERDQFNLMISSGELPDIIDASAIDAYYPGGAVKALADGVIIKLNDLQKTYAPDLTKIYSTYKDVDIQMKSDDGSYLSVPKIIGTAGMSTTSGLTIRKDMLDKVGLPVPATIDEWYTVLTAFKTKLGVAAPLLLKNVNHSFFKGGDYFIGAYGISHTYFTENGTVKYGPADPRYKDFLATYAKWYKEGLIDPEFATNNDKTFDAKASSNKAGAFYGFAGSGIGKYVPLAVPTIPEYQLVATPYPSLKKGEQVRFLQKSKTATPLMYITSKAKNPALAMAFLNYGYTREGYMLYNFGIEGTSYNWNNGYPKFTDLILKNPNGLSISAAMLQYQRSASNPPSVQDPRYLEQFYPYKEQSEALKVWSAYSGSSVGANDPVLQGHLTAEEASSISSAQAQIQTYVDEMLLKFVVGQQPVDDANFNAYLKQLKSLGIDNVLKTLQTSEDRFKKANPDFYTLTKVSEPYDLYKDFKK